MKQLHLVSSKGISSAFLGLLVLIMTVSAFSSAMAQGTPPAEAERSPNDADVQISIRPKDGSDGERFEAEIEPGESASLVAVLQNFGPEAIELRTYTADVLPVVNGGLALAELDADQHEPTTWMDYSTETRVFEPGQMIEKPFTISVPEGTQPGQYVNAVALETVNPIENDQPSAFEEYFRKIVTVYITVPGPLEPNFSFGEPEIQVQGSTGMVLVPLHNTGNVRLDLSGTFVLVDEAGEVVIEAPLLLGPVYGFQETVIRYVISSLPPEGDYTVSIELTDDSSEITNSSGQLALNVPAPEDNVPQAITFDNIVVEANADPIQFANVAVDVSAVTASYQSTRLTLSVFRNGESVEDFVLADNLSLPLGTTTVQQRYLPLTGWESGTYTFSLKLEDTTSGGASELYSDSDVATLEVP